MVAADARMPDEIVGDNALKMSESLIRPNGGSKVSKQQVRDAVELILAYAGNDPTAAMVEMGDALSMKFKGEFPSAELLCRRTIQRCKDEAAARKEKKLADARRADATADRVGSMQIGKPESPPKSPQRMKGRGTSPRSADDRDQEGDERPVTADSAFGSLEDGDSRPSSPASSRGSRGRSPRGLRLTRSLPDDNMKQWLADKKVKEEQRSKLKKQGSQKDLMWMKQLSEKQLARAKSLRKEQDDAARSARESERSGASTPTPFLGSDRSGANTPSTPERPPTVEEAAERLFGDL